MLKTSLVLHPELWGAQVNIGYIKTQSNPLLLGGEEFDKAVPSDSVSYGENIDSHLFRQSTGNFCTSVHAWKAPH